MKICIFKVKLFYEKKTWRKIAVPADYNLYQLAEAIIDVFDFNFDHCFGFFSEIKECTYFDSPKKYELFTDLIEEGEDIEPTGAKSVKKTKISQVWKNPKDKMLFLFDYGDDWKFIVELAEFSESIKKEKYPLVLDSKGQAPEQYPDCE